jgi:hypothetical protein
MNALTKAAKQAIDDNEKDSLAVNLFCYTLIGTVVVGFVVVFVNHLAK